MKALGRADPKAMKNVKAREDESKSEEKKEEKIPTLEKLREGKRAMFASVQAAHHSARALKVLISPFVLFVHECVCADLFLCS
jgi:hypothetical protein